MPKFGWNGKGRHSTVPDAALKILSSTGAGMPTVPAVVCLQKMFPELFVGNWFCFHGDGTSHGPLGPLSAVGSPTTQTLPSYNGLTCNPVTRQGLNANPYYATASTYAPTGNFSIGVCYVNNAPLVNGDLVCKDNGGTDRALSFRSRSDGAVYISLASNITNGQYAISNNSLIVGGTENVAIASYQHVGAGLVNSLSLYINGTLQNAVTQAPEFPVSTSANWTVGGMATRLNGSVRCAFVTEYTFTSQDAQRVQNYLFPMPQGTRGEQLTFARNSLASMTAQDGTVIWLPPGRPAVGASGYQVTNLLQWSEDFSQSPWSTFTSTRAYNATVDPQGGNNGTLLTGTASGGNVNQSFTASGSACTFSIWAKAATGSALRLELYDTTSSTSTVISPFTLTNGWQRFYVTATPTAGHTIQARVIAGNSGQVVGIYIWGAQLETGSTAHDYVKSTATNGSYTITTGSGLKMRPSVTNLLLWSEQFDSASWIKSSVTVTANATTAPDGSSTADQIAVTNSANGIEQTVTVNSSTTYTFSFFAKNNGSSDIKYSIYDATNAADIVAATSYVSQLADGKWHRISVTFTTPSTCTSVYCYPERNAGTSTTNFYIWGAQLETGSIASDYVRSEGSQGVMAAETCTVPMPGARTNLVQWSQDFSQSTWARSNATITANTALAPDGTNTSSKLIGNTSSVTHAVVPANWTGVDNGLYTVSTYAKAGELSNYGLIIECRDKSGTYQQARFDIVNGKVISKTSGVTNYSIASIGGGWYRCIATYSIGTGTSSQTGALLLYDTVGATQIFAGDGTSGIYIWGYQLEQSPCATDYIPTTSAAGTVTALNPKVDSRNLLLWSEDVTNAVWTKANTPVTANNQTAPDGSSNADTVSNTVNVNSYVIVSTVSLVPGNTYTTSIYAKSVTGIPKIFMESYISGNYRAVSFDLSNGTMANIPSWITANMVSVGNGWYRCSISATCTSSNDQLRTIYIGAYGSTATATSVALWGAQLEVGSVATEYRQTTSVIGNYQATSGLAQVSLTPTWTGGNPTASSMGLLIGNSANSSRFMIIGGAGQNTVQSTILSRFAPTLNANLTAGATRTYAAGWSSGKTNSYLTDLNSGLSVDTLSSTSYGFYGFPALDSTLWVGCYPAGNGQPSGAILSNIVFHTDPNGWIKNN